METGEPHNPGEQDSINGDERLSGVSGGGEEYNEDNLPSERDDEMLNDKTTAERLIKRIEVPEVWHLSPEQVVAVLSGFTLDPLDVARSAFRQALEDWEFQPGDEREIVARIRPYYEKLVERVIADPIFPISLPPYDLLYRRYVAPEEIQEVPELSRAELARQRMIEGAKKARAIRWAKQSEHDAQSERAKGVLTKEARGRGGQKSVRKLNANRWAKESEHEAQSRRMQGNTYGAGKGRPRNK